MLTEVLMYSLKNNKKQTNEKNIRSFLNITGISAFEDIY